MSFDRSRLVRGAAAGVVVLGLLVACTEGTTPSASPSSSAPSSAPATPSPVASAPADPPPAGSEVAAPAAAATVVDAGPAVAALEASRAVFVSAPAVVVADAGDPDGQLTAASIAVAVGAPVLLVGDGVSDAALAAEVRRLGATRVVAVGDVPDVGGVSLEAVAPGASAADLEAVTGVTFGDARRVKKGDGAAASAVVALDGERPVVLVGPTAHAPRPTSTPSATPTGSPTAGMSGPSSGDSAASSGAAASSAAPGPTTTPAPTVLPTAPAGLVALVGAGPTPVAALATLRAAGVPVVTIPGGDPRATSATVKAVATATPDSVIALGTGFGSPSTLAARVATARTGVLVPGGGQLVFPEGDGVRGKRYVALYGTPGSKALGVLGEQSVAKTVARATRTAKPYRALTKDTVVPMVEIIATIASASAGDDKDYSRERSVAELRPLVEAAHRKGLAVVLDLQPGRTDFLTQAKRYEDLLAMPNVGLALDPEWRLKKNQKHLRQIGSVKVAEVNRVGDWLAEFTAERHLPQKMFVLHQFSLSMIKDRSKLDVSHDELAVLIHVDGQGSQPAKRGTWKALRAGAPDVHWGWKNFYDEDHPMLSPKKTYKITPKPDLVTYQ
ncbi:hypothetical protein [Cellulomonas sp. PhB150]|uniref:hypothetical protein n=1 Tax=Cellulomonas sp. PhB150 TaxID=2485188 RepID=UPI00131573CF|nr:hypothetical protein [Cellulomonas sp. PhB150]